MVPPTQNLNLDITAISGICGSISIACWIVVFSPQIIENWRRGSADGLSLQFIIIWLAGDVFNIWGAMLQGVLPTMIILAVYYTIADVVLLGQCFYYKGFTWRDEVKPPPTPPTPPTPPKPTYAAIAAGTSVPTETTGLLSHQERRRSSISAQHLSPVVPLLEPRKPSDSPTIKPSTPTSPLQTFLFNFLSILLVCIAGIIGWYISSRSSHQTRSHHPSTHTTTPTFSPLGQTFGYLCAILYLSSRIPQLLLNHRRKSTQGISMLFFLFACIGNLTYVLSIFAYEAPCLTTSKHGHDACEEGEARFQYIRYVAVNASWIVGSAGTLLLDAGVFVQFFIYGDGDGEGKVVEEEVAVEGEGNGVVVGGA
ncbi:PQ loop repeat protein [Sclerotinia borealis F-4128]|uniref:PQ loop repeat protein n=1 Tax=Sclerotinia borealis (strain F-4128) TaxID=1432307 RepID=W9CC27_SCLBF|nr:PQ loop repeat protein [Sclerotinia borealis F-4128]